MYQFLCGFQCSFITNPVVLLSLPLTIYYLFWLIIVASYITIFLFL